MVSVLLYRVGFCFCRFVLMNDRVSMIIIIGRSSLLRFYCVLM